MMDDSARHIVAAGALIRNGAGEVALVRTERRGREIPGGQIGLGEALKSSQGSLRMCEAT